MQPGYFFAPVAGVVAAVVKPADLSAVASVERDLAELSRRDSSLAESALAATALAMARELDNGRNSATSKSMCARVLREMLDRLRELAPEEEKEDALDELGARRAARRANA